MKPATKVKRERRNLQHCSSDCYSVPSGWYLGIWWTHRAQKVS